MNYVQKSSSQVTKPQNMNIIKQLRNKYTTQYNFNIPIEHVCTNERMF